MSTIDMTTGPTSNYDPGSNYEPTTITSTNSSYNPHRHHHSRKTKAISHKQVNTHTDERRVKKVHHSPFVKQGTGIIAETSKKMDNMADTPVPVEVDKRPKEMNKGRKKTEYVNYPPQGATVNMSQVLGPANTPANVLTPANTPAKDWTPPDVRKRQEKSKKMDTASVKKNSKPDEYERIPSQVKSYQSKKPSKVSKKASKHSKKASKQSKKARKPDPNLPNFVTAHSKVKPKKPSPPANHDKKPMYISTVHTTE